MDGGVGFKRYADISFKAEAKLPYCSRPVLELGASDHAIRGEVAFSRERIGHEGHDEPIANAFAAQLSVGSGYHLK